MPGRGFRAVGIVEMEHRGLHEESLRPWVTG